MFINTSRGILHTLIVLSPFIFAPTLASAAVPAFPGAQGGGAGSVGGRGGQVIEVTNLNDSGAGSLRACVTALGPRTCVFTVSGTIQLQTGLRVNNPYLTVAGQTAPGGGILLSGPNNTDYGMVMIYAHDVIWQYTRIRKGFTFACSDGVGTDCGATLMTYSPAYNVMLDHNSVSWNQDEGISVWSNATPSAKNVTISWNLVAEPLAGHPTGMLVGGQTPAFSVETTDIDFHHNLTMNNGHRNPLLVNKSSRMVNNIYYNQYFYTGQVGGGIMTDFVGNLYKKGPLYASGGFNFHEIQAWNGSNGNSLAGDPSIYLSGNIGWNQTSATGDQWLLTSRVTGENGSESAGAIPSTWKRTSPQSGTTYPIVAEPVANLEGSIASIVGASRRVDCNGNWVANRDSVDTRLISQYQNDTGITSLIANESQVGGFPTIASGTACSDTDSDGMPDVWETAKGLNPNSAADRNSIAASGYTNLEQYINGTGAGTPPPPPPPVSKFVIGDRVQATADINVRSTPGGTLLYTQPVGALGTVTSGPTQTPNGVIWWEINYDNGTDGWSGEAYLVKYTPPADTTPPTVSITTPVSGATVSGTAVTVPVNTSDNVGVASVDFRVDGTVLYTDTASPYSMVWNTTTATNGSHTLTAVAKDAAGNTTTSAGVSVTVSNGTVLLPPSRLRLSLLLTVSPLPSQAQAQKAMGAAPLERHSRVVRQPSARDSERYDYA